MDKGYTDYFDDPEPPGNDNPDYVELALEACDLLTKYESLLMANGSAKEVVTLLEQAIAKAKQATEIQVGLFGKELERDVVGDIF